MHYGIEIVPFGNFSDPRQIVQMAQSAEASGWEGLWIWDHVVIPYGAADPWVTLAAVAASTQTIKLCVGVSPLPRYRPHLLARTLSGLDLLSQGRITFATGLGIASDFIPFGEPADARTLAAELDEGLGLLIGYLSGEELTHQGKYYSAKAVRIMPGPLQKPRIPVWIGGASNAALRRAARWDGWIIGTVDENSRITLPPQEIARKAAYIRQQRLQLNSFDIAVDGVTTAGEAGLVREYQDAGATWWFEIIHALRGTPDELARRILAGPPV
ncbi:MAG TPA: LLM class flavin-dependent oxidoreductase [Anaerolineales bacterium]|nr:LLM class flavin-dependent oxidoreductase [Anaerolineales bacterium]